MTKDRAVYLAWEVFTHWELQGIPPFDDTTAMRYEEKLALVTDIANKIMEAIEEDNK